MKKIFILGVALLLLIPALTSFGGQRKVLKVGVQMFENKNWDPAASYNNRTAQYHINLHDGLVRLSTMEVPYKVLPALATSWKEISPTVTEFKLRQGAKFWDGTYITAEDVKWSLERSINKELPAYVGGAFGRVLYNFEKVEIVNASTVRVHNRNPDPLKYVMLAQTTSAILSKKAFDAAASPEDFFTRPVGAGPYRIAEFKQDQYVKFESWDDYWGEKPPLEELWYYSIKEPTARITALVNGEVDFIVDIPPDMKSALDGKKGIKSQGVTLDMFYAWMFNMTRHPLKDQRIRKAISLAIDRDALNQGLYGGKGVTPTSHHYPGRTGYFPGWKIYEYNPDKARQLLKEANYDGSVVELSDCHYYYLYNDLATQAMAKMLEKVGINAKVVTYGPGSWPPAQPVEEYNMVRCWSNPMYFPDMMGGVDPAWAPTSWPYLQGQFPIIAPGGDLHELYIGLYKKARYDTDPERRKRYYKQFIEFLEDEVTPFFIGYQPHLFFGMDEDIVFEAPANYRPYTMPFRAGDVTFK